MAPRRFRLFWCLLVASEGFWWFLFVSVGFWLLLVVSGLWHCATISRALLIFRCSYWPLLTHVGSVGCCSWFGGASPLLAVLIPLDDFWWFLVAAVGFWLFLVVSGCFWCLLVVSRLWLRLMLSYALPSAPTPAIEIKRSMFAKRQTESRIRFL